MKRKMMKKILILLLVISGTGMINVDAVVNTDYANLRSYQVTKNSKTICAAPEIKVEAIGTEGKISEDKVNAGLKYEFDYYGTKTQCEEKSKIDATKITQADVGKRFINVKNDKYVVYGCYCDKTTYDNYYESCLNYFGATDESACAKNRAEQLDTYYDPNCEDKKWDEPCGTRTPNKELGLKANPNVFNKNLEDLFKTKPRGIINACAHSNSFVFEPIKTGTKNKKSDEQCIITAVNSNGYEYKPCTEINKIFEKKVSTLAESISKGLAGTATTSVTRTKNIRSDGYTEIHINLGPEILQTLKTIPYNSDKSAISDLKVKIYKDDATNKCSDYFKSGNVSATCNPYATGSFNSNGELVFNNNSFRDTHVFVEINYEGVSPCGKSYSSGFDLFTEFVIYDDVPNSNYNAGVCKVIKDAKNTYKDDSFIASLIDLVPECKKETLSYEENEIFKTQQTELTAMINSILEVYKQKKNSAAPKIDKSNCAFNPAKNIKNEPISSYTGIKLSGKTLSDSYWGAICVEDLYIDYDTPQGPLFPSESFLYETRLKVKRNCTMVQLKLVRLKSLCKVTTECQGDDHKGSKNAGPNEDFEECVNTCDNGKYTQKCIDKCYKEVYEDNITSNINKTSYNIFDESQEKLLAMQETAKIERMASETTPCHESIGCPVETTTNSAITKMKKKDGYYVSPDDNIITSCKVYDLNSVNALVGTDGKVPTQEQINKAEEARKNCTKYNNKNVSKEGYKYWQGYLQFPSRQFIDYGYEMFHDSEGNTLKPEERQGVLKPQSGEGCWDNGGGDKTKWVDGGICLSDGWNNVTYAKKGAFYKIITENGAEFDFAQGCMGYTMTSYNWNELDSNGNNGKATSTTKGAVKCYEVLNGSDANCSFNPKVDYYNELAESRRQYESLYALLKSKEVPEDDKANYKVEVKEKYGTSEIEKTLSFANRKAGYTDGKYQVNYTTSADDFEPQPLTVTKKIGMGSGVHTYDEKTDKEVTLYRFESTRYIKINIGTAYTINGSYGGSFTPVPSDYKKSETSSSVIYNVSYYGTGRDTRIKTSDNGPILGYVLSNTTKLNVNQPYTWPDARSALDNGKYTYTYTNYKGESKTDYDIFNKEIVVDGVTIPKYEPNIIVNLTNFGTFGQWSTNNSSNPYLLRCMYSTKKEAIGNEIIFRPIDLTNVFPGDDVQENSGDGRGRAPRYNWTGTVLEITNPNSSTTGAALNLNNSYYLSETVDPEKLTAYIQKQGYKIYDDAQKDENYGEYIFRLTPATIRKVRDYNKSVNDYNGDGRDKTYLDFNLNDCTRYGNAESKTQNRNVCTSIFLNNYIDFKSSTRRTGIKGCNNGSPTSNTCEKISIGG